MPVIAIGAAVIGASELIAGGLTVMETISAVGAVIGGIGALTGNKDMMMVGSVAALAGGIGAFAQGKGWIASDGPLADPGSNITTLKNTSSQIAQEALNPTDARLAAGTQTTPLAAEGGEATAVTNALADSQGGGTSGLMNASSPEAPAPTPPSPATEAASSSSYGVNPDVNAKDSLLDRLDVKSPMGGIDGSKSSGSLFGMFKDFGTWANNNKTLASIGANFIGGIFDREKRAKGDYYEAEASLARQQLENMKSVPNMNFRSSGKVGFPTTAPTYTPVQIGGLYSAR